MRRQSREQHNTSSHEYTYSCTRLPIKRKSLGRPGATPTRHAATRLPFSTSNCCRRRRSARVIKQFVFVTISSTQVAGDNTSCCREEREERQESLISCRRTSGGRCDRISSRDSAGVSYVRHISACEEERQRRLTRESRTAGHRNSAQIRRTRDETRAAPQHQQQQRRRNRRFVSHSDSEQTGCPSPHELLLSTCERANASHLRCK